MTANDKEPKTDDIQREIRSQQKFSLAGAIGRSVGGAMKGASPIPKLAQVTTEIIYFINHNTPDPSGALKSILRQRIKANELIVGHHIDNPLLALREIIQPILDNDSIFYEFVRQVDVRWGEIFVERPLFQQPGQTPHPDDEYTHNSVKKDLMVLLGEVVSAIPDTN